MLGCLVLRWRGDGTAGEVISTVFTICESDMLRFWFPCLVFFPGMVFWTFKRIGDLEGKVLISGKWGKGW